MKKHPDDTTKRHDDGASRTPKDMASPALAAVDAVAAPARFEDVYDQYAAFVWRSARRLGVADAALEDVVQEVFLVVHRRLGDFEGRSSLKTWLFGIALGVVRNHRRSQRRKRIDASRQASDVLERVAGGDQPDETTERARALKLLHALLDQLDDDKREVFVMAELEQMRGTEIAALTGLNLNTVYARLKAARQAFNQAVARVRAREWSSA